jgi:hypothetical protein
LGGWGQILVQEIDGENWVLYSPGLLLLLAAAEQANVMPAL